MTLLQHLQDSNATAKATTQRRMAEERAEETDREALARTFRTSYQYRVARPVFKADCPLHCLVRIGRQWCSSEVGVVHGLVVVLRMGHDDGSGMWMELGEYAGIGRYRVYIDSLDDLQVLQPEQVLAAFERELAATAPG